MQVQFTGIQEIKFVTPESRPIKRNLINTAFYWEQEAPRAREAFVKRGRVFNLNDQDGEDRSTHRALVQGVLSEETRNKVNRLTSLADLAARWVGRKASTGLKQSGHYITLRSFEEDCVARFDMQRAKDQIIQTIMAIRNGPDDVTFKKQPPRHTS